jgi:hypothetical protein
VTLSLLPIVTVKLSLFLVVIVTLSLLPVVTVKLSLFPAVTVTLSLLPILIVTLSPPLVLTVTLFLLPVVTVTLSFLSVVIVVSPSSNAHEANVAQEAGDPQSLLLLLGVLTYSHTVTGLKTTQVIQDGLSCNPSPHFVCKDSSQMLSHSQVLGPPEPAAGTSASSSLSILGCEWEMMEEL